MGISTITNNLPGVLGRNAVETDAITTFFDHYSNFTWDTFTEELFDVDTNDGAVWEKEEWYCTACMTNLYTTRFPSWYIAEPKGGMYRMHGRLSSRAHGGIYSLGSRKRGLLVRMELSYANSQVEPCSEVERELLRPFPSIVKRGILSNALF